MGSDSCFTASPASAIAPMPPLQLSGIGMLSFNSDSYDKSINNSSTMDPVGRAAMPPPPMKPKPVRRCAATLLNESGSLGKTSKKVIVLVFASRKYLVLKLLVIFVAQLELLNTVQ